MTAGWNQVYQTMNSPTNTLLNLLKQNDTDEDAMRCLNALLEELTVVRSVGPISTSEVRTIYTKRSRHNSKQGNPIQGFERLLSSLASFEEDQVRIILMTTNEEWFEVFTNTAIDKLLGILSERSNKLMRYFLEHPEA